MAGRNQTIHVAEEDAETIRICLECQVPTGCNQNDRRCGLKHRRGKGEINAGDGEWRPKTAVVAIDPQTGKEVARYPSMTQAAIAVNGFAAGVSGAITYDHRVYRGYLWRKLSRS